GISTCTCMIVIIGREQAHDAAEATKQALTFAEEALPFLQRDKPSEMAEGIAHLLYDRLKVAAISITNEDYVLAHEGLGSDHHKAKKGIITDLYKKTIRDKKTKIAYSKKDIECSYEDCPLEAAIIVPIISTEEDIGLIKFYFEKVQ